jgi:hypothetical protein
MESLHVKRRTFVVTKIWGRVGLQSWSPRVGTNPIVGPPPRDSLNVLPIKGMRMKKFIVAACCAFLLCGTVAAQDAAPVADAAVAVVEATPVQSVVAPMHEGTVEGVVSTGCDSCNTCGCDTQRSRRHVVRSVASRSRGMFTGVRGRRGRCCN